MRSIRDVLRRRGQPAAADAPAIETRDDSALTPFGATPPPSATPPARAAPDEEGGSAEDKVEVVAPAEPDAAPSHAVAADDTEEEGALPPVATPPVEAPPVEAPPVEAPPVEAPPDEETPEDVAPRLTTNATPVPPAPLVAGAHRSGAGGSTPEATEAVAEPEVEAAPAGRSLYTPTLEPPATDATPSARRVGAATDVAEPAAGVVPFALSRLPVNAYSVVLTGLGTALFFAFLLIEPTPRWMLLVGAVVVILGMDGVLRATWREPFASEGDTTPYLFLPALFVLAAPTIIEHNLAGYWLLPAGVAISAGFGAVVLAQLVSVRTGAPEYPVARIVSTVAAYFVLFALASMTYVFDVSLPMALLAIALLSLMLGIEVLREGEIDPLETLVLAIVTALIVTQARWLLHYVSIDDYLAGLVLTLVFFVTSGLLHAYVQRQFTLALAAQYSAITASGLVLIVVARTTGLA